MVREDLAHEGTQPIVPADSGITSGCFLCAVGPDRLHSTLDHLDHMADSGNTFSLRSRGVTLGTVVAERDDWPWTFGRFVPSPEFRNHESLFAAAVLALRDKDAEKRSALIGKITAMELQLVRCDTGILAGEPDLLWIDGDRIWWRGHHGALRRHIHEGQGTP